MFQVYVNLVMLILQDYAKKVKSRISVLVGLAICGAICLSLLSIIFWFIYKRRQHQHFGSQIPAEGISIRSRWYLSSFLVGLTGSVIHLEQLYKFDTCLLFFLWHIFIIVNSRFDSAHKSKIVGNQLIQKCLFCVLLSDAVSWQRSFYFLSVFNP